MARHLLHDRDGALADERDMQRVGAHAVARDTAGGVGGTEAGGLGANLGSQVLELLCFPGPEADPVQPELSPVVWHHRDHDLLGFR